MKLQRHHKIIIIITAIICLSGAVALISFSFHRDNVLKIFFLDVGQGDAILIQTPTHQNILIDGGPDNSVLAKLGQYLPWLSRDLDLVILTHPHADHLYGLIEVLKRYQVKKIINTNINYNGASYKAFLDIAQNKNIPVSNAYYGQIINFSATCFLKILYPLTAEKITKYKSLNSASIVSQLNCAQTKTLLTGDIDNISAQKIYGNNIDLHSDILKASHHGSAEGNDLNFLQQIKAPIAVISVGAKNKFGHPNAAAINNLNKLKTKIWRTDQNGDIIFIIKNGLIYTKN